MAQQLWAAGSVAAWQDVRQQLDTTWAKASDKLRLLNSWYETELPAAISGRAPAPHITQPELVQLVDWKLTHGKWRPRLLDFAKAAQPADVQHASTQAFALLQEGRRGGDASAPPSTACVKAALEALTVLKGVGPATASALLAAVDSSCPFMGDEALEVALGGRSYTAKEYLQLVEAVRTKAEWLTQQDADAAWSAVLVERCLYAAALAARAGAAPKAGAVKAPAAKAPGAAAAPAKSTAAAAAARPAGAAKRPRAAATGGAKKAGASKKQAAAVKKARSK